MPEAVTHVLLPLILMAFVRDYYIRKKDRKKFPLHYVLIAGIAGVAPDLDIAAYWILHFFGFTLGEVHRTFTHTIFVPLIFLALFALFWRVETKPVGRHNLKLHLIFLMIAYGCLFHIILDFIFSGTIRPLYPFSEIAIGLNLVRYLPQPLDRIFFPCFDAALLMCWLIYVEWKHKISDFI